MTTYRCDYRMNHLIKDEPWLEYISEYKRVDDKNILQRVYGLRIICKDHLQRYGYRDTERGANTIVSDCPVETFKYKNSMVDMFDLLAGKKCDLESAIPVYKRLYIPGYEEARGKYLDLIEEWHFTTKGGI